MEHLDGILKLAENELSAIEQNGKFRSRDEVDTVYKLIDVAKDIYCIWNYEDGMEDDEYSGRYDESRAYRSYNDGSYARGRGRGAKRDSMGRYSREGSYRGGSNRGSYRGGSYRDGYSREDEKHQYVEHLRDMMEDAPDEQTRQSLQRMISQMEQG